MRLPVERHGKQNPLDWRKAANTMVKAINRGPGNALPPTDSVESEIDFDAATRRLKPALVRYAQQLTRNSAAAEDLMQDTLLRAWVARSHFQPGTNFRAWMFRIAHNSFVSGLRRARWQVAWNPQVHDNLMICAPMQDDAFYRADFERALQQLPLEQAEAFLMVTRDDMPYALAAERLGIRRNTLASRVSRARSTLRSQCLAEGQAERGPTEKTTKYEGPLPASRTDAYYQWQASGSRVIG